MPSSTGSRIRRSEQIRRQSARPESDVEGLCPQLSKRSQRVQKSQRGSTVPITRQLQESPRGKLLDTGDVERPHIHKVARDGCGGSHNGADQMGAAVFALTPLEVTVRSAGAALMRRQNIGVHPDAHAATRIAPLEACLAENLVESFF